MSAGLVGAYIAIAGIGISGVILASAVQHLMKACKENSEANLANTRAIASHTTALNSLASSVERVSTKTSINVTGITDPAAVAAAVKKSLDRRNQGGAL